MSMVSGATTKGLVRKYLWLIFLVLGALGFLTVYFLMPRQSEINTPLEMIYRLFVFLLITCGIAFFPNQAKRSYLLLLIPILGFLGYIFPRADFYGFVGIPEGFPNAVGEFYISLYLMMYPGLLLTVMFAYRLGGGTPGACLKIVWSGVILIFSGYLDVLYYVVNPVGFPETIEYAHHIEMVIGFYPSYGEGIVFALAHLPLLVGLLLLPLDKWIGKLLGWLETPASAETPAKAETLTPADQS